MIDVVFEADDGTLLPLVLDAVPTEQHRSSAVATEYEVERGVAPSDHVRPERRLLTFEVVITDTPHKPNAAIGGSVRPYTLTLPDRVGVTKPTRRNGESWDAAEHAEGGAPTTTVSLFQLDTLATRVADSWQLLERARTEALLAIVSTKYDTYENVVLVEKLANRTAADGSWLRAELTFAELRLVSTEVVADPVPLRPRDRRRVDRGSQEAQEASPRLQSLLSQGLDALFGGG